MLTHAKHIERKRALVEELNKLENKIREDKVSLASIYDVTNPLGHYCTQSQNKRLIEAGRCQVVTMTNY